MKSYFSHSSCTNRTLTEKEIRQNALLSDLEQTKKALEIAYAGFDNVTEPDLIDCYIYEVNSVLKRYKFLLGQAERLDLLSPEHQLLPDAYQKLCPESPVASLVS